MTTPFALTPNPTPHTASGRTPVPRRAMGRGARFAFSLGEKVAACNAAG
jgi:hypothetical protein